MYVFQPTMGPLRSRIKMVPRRTETVRGRTETVKVRGPSTLNGARPVPYIYISLTSCAACYEYNDIHHKKSFECNTAKAVWEVGGFTWGAFIHSCCRVHVQPLSHYDTACSKYNFQHKKQLGLFTYDEI